MNLLYLGCHAHSCKIEDYGVRHHSQLDLVLIAV